MHLPIWPIQNIRMGLCHANSAVKLNYILFHMLESHVELLDQIPCKGISNVTKSLACGNGHVKVYIKLSVQFYQ